MYFFNHLHLKFFINNSNYCIRVLIFNSDFSILDIMFKELKVQFNILKELIRIIFLKIFLEEIIH